MGAKNELHFIGRRAAASPATGVFDRHLANQKNIIRLATEANIDEIEKFLKVHIDVVAKDSEELFLNSNDLPFSFSESKTALLLTVNREFTSLHADIYLHDKFFTSVRIGKKGQIKIPKRSDTGRNLLNQTSSQNDIKIYLKDF